jgi:hypothetical protein
MMFAQLIDRVAKLEKVQAAVQEATSIANEIFAPRSTAHMFPSPAPRNALLDLIARVPGRRLTLSPARDSSGKVVGWIETEDSDKDPNESKDE